MRPKKITYSPAGTGALAWHPWRRADGQKTLQIVVNGTMTYKVQHTAGNLQDGSTVTAVDDTEVTGKTAGGLYKVDAVLSGSRLNITAFTSGTISVTYLEERTYG